MLHSVTIFVTSVKIRFFSFLFFVFARCKKNQKTIKMSYLLFINNPNKNKPFFISQIKKLS